MINDLSTDIIYFSTYFFSFCCNFASQHTI